MQPLLILETIAGAESGRRVEVSPGDSLRFGRTSRSTIVFPHDPLLSGVHFAIYWSANQWMIQDLNSTNGTFVNRERVTNASLKVGDSITAGMTAFVVRSVSTTAPGLPELPSAPVAPPSATRRLSTTMTIMPMSSAGGDPEMRPKQRLVANLRRQPASIFALLDAARDPRILKMLRDSEAAFDCLYDGQARHDLEEVAPYLVSLPEDTNLLENLIESGWGKAWGVFLASDEPLDHVRTHLRHFTMVERHDGHKMFFRFYDPRVLRIYLPTCNPEETVQFFGPVIGFLMEGDKPDTLLRFTNGPLGAQRWAQPLGRWE